MPVLKVIRVSSRALRENAGRTPAALQPALVIQAAGQTIHAHNLTVHGPCTLDGDGLTVTLTTDAPLTYDAGRGEQRLA